MPFAMRSIRLQLVAVGIIMLTSAARAQTGQVLFTEDLPTWQAAAGASYVNTTSNYGSTSTALGSGSVSYNAGQVVTIGVTWNTWCCEYGGQAVSTGLGVTSTILTLSGVSAFGLQIEPDGYQLEGMTVTLSNGQTLTGTVNGDAGAQFFGFVGSGITSLTISDNAGDDFAFGNFYSGNPSPVTISNPTQNATFPAGGSGYNIAGPVTFNAATFDSSMVSWTVKLTYKTTGGKCTGCTTLQNFQAPSGADVNQSYTSIGGQMVATAADDLNDTANVTAYIVGAAIPTATEVTLLDSIYSGPTSNLLSGIAQVESSTHQFVQTSDFGISAYWPHESYDGGSHIGLLQLPVAMNVAWDYTINANQGKQLFVQKFASAKRIMKQAIATYSGLPTLTGVRLENMALVLYGPYAKAGLTKQYYAPFCQGGTVNGNTCSGGVWVWVVNTANNPKGVAYANKCRASVQ